MIIEDPDAFKTWLTAVLKPICVADPEALAKYVIALVKKDKSPDALHTSMVNQLQVFLQEETKPFVDQLFSTLNNQAYLNSVVPNTNPPNPSATVLTKSELPTKAALNKPVIPVAEIAALSETLNGKGAPQPAKRDEEQPRKETRVENKDKERDAKERENKDDKSRRRPRRRSGSRGRSRSRSWDRGRRSRSRDKDKRDRARGWRAKSPYFRGGRYRNRSPPRSRSHSRSRSPVEQPAASGGGDEENKQAQPATAAVVPVQPGSEARKRRCRDYDEEGYCMRGGMCPYDHGVDAVVLEDSALSRVLYPNGTSDSILGAPPTTGHMMPRAGPPGPLTVEYNPQAPQMWHQRGPGGGGGFRGHRGGLNQGPPRMPMGQFHGGGPPPAMPLNNMQRELIAVPVLGSEAPPPMDKYGFGGPPSIPVGGYQPDGPGGGGGVFKKKQFDFNRLGARAKNPTNCSLELKKVPTGLNNIMHLNNHFAKFGKIVNIQVSFEGDPEAAIVTFSSHAEANAAYRSTEAVLNNRFIKVFWHSGGAAGETKDGSVGGAPPVRSIKERLGQGGNVPPNANKFLHVAHGAAMQEKENTANTLEDGGDDEKEAIAQREERLRQATARAEELKAAVRKKQEVLAAKEQLKKNQEEKRKLAQDLRKRKQDLLEKQIAQQKLLIEKMGKSPPGAQRDLLMQTIKKSQESIEVIRKDLAQAVLALKTAATPTIGNAQPKRSKEAMQKELLDAELDLISKQAEGVDTTDLQKKLWELKAKAGAPAPITVGGVMIGAPRGRGRGARRFNPLGRHKLVKNNLNAEGPAAKAHALDHRPTRLLVSGYEADEHAAVLAHFRHFGEIVECEDDDALPSVVIAYRTRKEAEHALAKGRHFADRTLSVTWAGPAARAGGGNTLPTNTRSASTEHLLDGDDEEDEDDQLLDGDDEAGDGVVGAEADFAEDALLQDDEEDEEENEDRSWRR